MIRKSLKPNSKVFNESFGFGTFIGWETDHDKYKGYAVVSFEDYPGYSLIHRKRLTEVEK